jgi:glycosyltransferase involved in cell wall biosynthesis
VLAVIETHPVQYHAPVYRALQQHHGVPVTVIYGADFSVAGYRDREFGASFMWDTDLLSGYSSVFLSRVATGGAASFEAVSTAGVRRALAEVRPSAVMIVGYSPRFNRVAWFEARRSRLPVLFRGETSDAAQERSWLKSRVRGAALGLAYRSCDQCLYIGTRSREHFERLGVPADRLVFSPYCVDTAAFEAGETDRARLRDPMRQELGLTDDQIVLLYSGKLSHRKGVDLLVDAARLLPESVRGRIVILLVGEGDRRAELHQQAAELPPVAVLFAGFQNQTRLSRYYHAADMLVLPSRHSETWGLVVNDALHHGLPCVVSDQVGCAPDLISDRTGAVCRAESPGSLAAAIDSALALHGRLNIRHACRDVVSGFTVDLAAEGIARAYRASVPGRATLEHAS